MLNCFAERENCIICGDFNLVLNPKFDYKNYKSYSHNVQARNRLLSLIEEEDYVDIFREIHGDTRKYT